MSVASDRAARLAQVAALLSDRALAPVALAHKQVLDAKARVAAIAEARRLLCGDVDDLVQAALLARRAEGLRHGHIAAMSDLARLQAQLDQAKAVARPAFGRKIALDRLQGQPSHRAEG